MNEKIVKVGVYSEYSKPKDIWGFTVWAQDSNEIRFHLKEWSPTFVAAQYAAEYFLGSELDSDWEKVSD